MTQVHLLQLDKKHALHARKLISISKCDTANCFYMAKSGIYTGNVLATSVAYASVTLSYFRKDTSWSLVKLQFLGGEKEGSYQDGSQGAFWCATGVRKVIQVGAAGGEVCAL